MKNQPIYLDYNATTPCDPRVIETMLPYFCQVYANPANSYNPFGRAAARAVDKARESYHRHYCGYSVADKDHKHLMLDSSLLGIDGTCDALCYLIRARFGLS